MSVNGSTCIAILSKERVKSVFRFCKRNLFGIPLKSYLCFSLLADWTDEKILIRGKIVVFLHCLLSVYENTMVNK